MYYTIAGLLTVLCGVLRASARLTGRATIIDNASSLNQEYDYVIIGGGTSGLTVANRLTEDQSISVLVIEYGPVDKEEPGVLVPGLPPPKIYQRNYMSTPNPELYNRPQEANSAAVVGGGTVINGMFFNRGSAPDYNAWKDLGNKGWGFDDLLPYFKKSENFTPASSEIAQQYPTSPDLGPHGTDGPVQSSFPLYQYPVLKYFFSAWNSIGVASNPQPNAGRAVGAFYSPLSLTFWNQSRCSASTAYFRPIDGKRPNFHLIPLHSVSKIIIDPKGKKASGVEFASRNETKSLHTVKTRKEVILAAGTYRSPGLLHLSGIGPEKLLSSLGIKKVENLPGVGYNFHDQPWYSAIVAYDSNSYPAPSPMDLATPSPFYDQQLQVYYTNRTGPFTQPYFSGTTTAFLPLQNLSNKYQDIIEKAKTVNLKQALPKEADPSILEGYKAQQKQILKAFASPDTAVHEMAMSGTTVIPLVLLKPLSRGSVLINSTDSLADPVVDYGTYRHRSDVDVAITFVQKIRDFTAAQPWKAVGLQLVNLAQGAVNDDQAIESVIRNTTVSTWNHPVGTCSMLPREKGGVVDSRLRVYGINGLRVVDASIMPIVPASHTSSTVYAVAEKAADLIKEDQRKK